MLYINACSTHTHTHILPDIYNECIQLHEYMV